MDDFLFDFPLDGGHGIAVVGAAKAQPKKKAASAAKARSSARPSPPNLPDKPPPRNSKRKTGPLSRKDSGAQPVQKTIRKKKTQTALSCSDSVSGVPRPGSGNGQPMKRPAAGGKGKKGKGNSARCSGDRCQTLPPESLPQVCGRAPSRKWLHPRSIRLASDCSGMGTEHKACELCTKTWPHPVKICHAMASDSNKSCRKFLEKFCEPQVLLDDCMADKSPYVKQWKNTLDLYTNGSPCQSYSVAGAKGGFGDGRGQLVTSGPSFIDKFRPRSFLLENVGGMVTMFPEVLSTLIEDLRSIKADNGSAAYNVQHLFRHLV